jgi:chromosome segregation ATPase
MDSIDEQIARIEARVISATQNITTLQATKNQAEAELENLKKKRKIIEKKKVKNRAFELAKNLLDIASMREDDDDVAKACWMAIDKIKSVVDILDITTV